MSLTMQDASRDTDANRHDELVLQALCETALGKYTYEAQPWRDLGVDEDFTRTAGIFHAGKSQI